MRSTCPRCLRPEAMCVCALAPPAAARTRVVLLQHPREARLAICSARLTRLALRNAELHRGVVFEGHARVRELAAAPGAALLFPGEGARPAAELAGAPPPVLFVLDGTWFHAERMLLRNPTLAALPRLSVASDVPSSYGALREEPAPHCLATVDAVACALGALERDPARFEPMRAAFREQVARQLACATGARRSPRHRPGRGPA
ncbi:MAG TPA: tRNA-uridine aminocarboxypropyltransferase, partial [Anaeromyxobacteraceae bacterium]|nr:tRNA-uridine aminocarboxypropyltransferase [Anaeromyxobacteraceae bacterium]